MRPLHVAPFSEPESRRPAAAPPPEALGSGEPGPPTRDERVRAMVAEHFDRVWRLLRRLGVPQALVDDSAQEVFAVAARRVDEISAGSEKSYLFGTALRVAKGVLRRDARERARRAPFEDQYGSPQETPEELVEQRRRLALLDRALEKLEERERMVFVLFEIEGLTLHEIAEVSQLPRGTVASRLRRARSRFVRALRVAGGGAR